MGIRANCGFTVAVFLLSGTLSCNLLRAAYNIVLSLQVCSQKIVLQLQINTGHIWVCTVCMWGANKILNDKKKKEMWWKKPVTWMINCVMFFIHCQTLSLSCRLLLSLTVRCGQVSQTFHILNSNFPSAPPPFSPPGWCFLTGRPQGRFQAWLPTARHLCQPLERANWLPLGQQHRAQGSAASASGPAEQPLLCPEPSCLGRTASPWTQSPPTRAIPTTPDAPGDPTGMGKTKSFFVNSSVSSRLCFYLEGSGQSILF